MTDTQEPRTPATAEIDLRTSDAAVILARYIHDAATQMERQAHLWGSCARDSVLSHALQQNCETTCEEILRRIKRFVISAGKHVLPH